MRNTIHCQAGSPSSRPPCAEPPEAAILDSPCSLSLFPPSNCHLLGLPATCEAVPGMTPRHYSIPALPAGKVHLTNSVLKLMDVKTLWRDGGESTDYRVSEQRVLFSSELWVRKWTNAKAKVIYWHKIERKEFIDTIYSKKGSGRHGEGRTTAVDT